MKRIIETVLGVLALPSLVQIVTVLLMGGHCDVTNMDLLLINPILIILLLVFAASAIQAFAPLFENAKQYWRAMPAEDRRELTRILGQALKVILRKPAQDGNRAARFVQWVFHFPESS